MQGCQAGTDRIPRVGLVAKAMANSIAVRMIYYAVAATTALAVVWTIRRLAKRRGRRMSVPIPIAVGDPSAQRRFIESHRPFLEEFPALQGLLEECLRLSEEKCYAESPNGDNAELTDEELAQRVAFYLERAAYEDFGELLILAGNGMGLGAKKTLRSIYERLVTAMFIGKNPLEARIFLDHADIEKGKVLNRMIATVPQLLNKDLTPEEIKRIQDGKKAAIDRKKIEYCDECNQPITDEAWTRVSLDTMAKKVDESLLKLYGTCYLSPTLLIHATPFGLDLRFRKTKAGPEAHAHGALWRGHFLMLWLLRHQDSYFKLGLGPQIDARCAAFSAIWPEDSAGS
jgi:uncharacterized protein DUF5677